MSKKGESYLHNMLMFPLYRPHFVDGYVGKRHGEIFQFKQRKCLTFDTPPPPPLSLHRQDLLIKGTLNKFLKHVEHRENF
jgi:hypothetical protein